MGSSDVPQNGEPTAEFEQELAELVTTAFAHGATIEQLWEITVPAAAAPNWRVEITKTYDDDDQAYDPEFIDD